MKIDLCEFEWMNLYNFFSEVRG